MSKFNVSGDNNRIAGNDYHEHRAPEPCPCCEQRYLTAGRTYCRHCEAQFEQEKVQRRFAEEQRKKQGLVIKIIKVLMAVMIVGLALNLFGPEFIRGHGLVVAVTCAFSIIMISKILK